MRQVLCSVFIGLGLVAFGATAQTPQEVLKAGTVLTFERANKIGSNGLPSDEKWTYTHQVIAVGDEISVTEVGRSGQPRAMKAMRDLQFPISAGKTWKHQFEFQRMSPGGQQSTYMYSGEAKVAGEDMIVVGDQSFKAYRIEFNGWVNRQGGGQALTWPYARTDWYAPAVGYVVQSDYKEIDKGRPIVHSTFRLLKVEPGK